MSEQKFFPTLFQHLATDTNRNLIISAGAGAGKTAVLTRRLIKILREEKLALHRLMVVTFTDKAAVEMKERVYSAIDKEIEARQDEHFKKLRDDFLKNRISTFHAFCAALLREYPIEAQIDPYFRVMDETDKIFFLRRVIERMLSSLAEQKQHPELTILSHEWSKGIIANIIYSIIQRREHLGPWLRDIQHVEWETYQERLTTYRKNVIRETCYKIGLKNTLLEVTQVLKAIAPEPPDDQSKLSQRREALLELLPALQLNLLQARSENFEPEPVLDLIKRVLTECNLSGGTAKAWKRVPDDFEQLKIAIMTIRNLFKVAQLDQYEINWALEAEAFEISRALARVSTICLDAYRTEKEKEHFLDFQDMQLKVLSLLKSPKGAHVLSELRENYLYIMVDEFQDTNALQWDIVKLIASDEQRKLFGDRLFIVGDEKQAIYSFRGGDVTLFNKVKQELIAANQTRATHQQPYILAASTPDDKDYQQEYQEKILEEHKVRAGEIIFSDNFRSAKIPICFFNLFFEKLMGQPFYEEFEAQPQRLVCSGNKHEGSVELLLVDRAADQPDEALQIPTPLEEIDIYTKEAHLIAEKIKTVLTGDAPIYDFVRQQAAAGKPAIAILLNRRTKLKIYEEALRRENIDFIVVRGLGFYQRQEIVDLGNLLGFLADPTNSIYLAGFLRSPVGHVSDEGLYLLSRVPSGETLWEKLEHLFQNESADFAKHFSQPDFEALTNAHRLLKRWDQLRRRLVFVDFLRLVLDEGGYFATLARGNRGEQALSNIEKLLEHAREVTLSEQEDFLTFTNWLNERIDYVDEEGEADVDIMLGGAVQLMTVHQSKGLEFPMVFVPDLNAYFNFGEREFIRFDDIVATLKINPEGSILRTTNHEVGIDVPNPEKNFEPTPTLIKKIIEKRNREKIIAERKRLFYVAATRAMDHLILVGQLKKRSEQATQEEKATGFDQLKSWMDWLSKILELIQSVNGSTGIVTLADENGEKLDIPYRLFDESQSVLHFEEQLRTEFPV